MKTNWISVTWRKTALFAGLIAICMIGCKDNTEDFSDEEAITENTAIGDNEADDVSQLSYTAEFDSKSGRSERTLPSCAIVSNDKAAKILTIDFGAGCVNAYGRTRSGKILVAYTTTIGDSLANRIITFENYKVNNKSIEGTIELRDISINPAGNLQSTRKMTDLKVSFPNGKSVTFNGSRTREWLAGKGDNDPTNNKFKLTGTVTGISSTGKTFTHEITVPVIVDFACAKQGNLARISGVVETSKVSGYGARKRTVDYGDGTCDKIITVTTFRRTYTITVD